MILRTPLGSVSPVPACRGGVRPREAEPRSRTAQAGGVGPALTACPSGPPPAPHPPLTAPGRRAARRTRMCGRLFLSSVLKYQLSACVCTGLALGCGTWSKAVPPACSLSPAWVDVQMDTCNTIRYDGRLGTGKRVPGSAAEGAGKALGKCLPQDMAEPAGGERAGRALQAVGTEGSNGGHCGGAAGRCWGGCTGQRVRHGDCGGCSYTKTQRKALSLKVSFPKRRAGNTERGWPLQSGY